MSTARATVLQQLDVLADDAAQIRPYARLNRQPAKTTILVRMDEIEPRPQVGAFVRTYKFALIVLGTKLVTDDDEKGGVDDELDLLVEQLLDALDVGPTDLIWTSAKRGTYEATDSPCYIIETELTGTYESEVTP